MKVYVATALTHAPHEYKEFVERFKDHLRIRHEVLDFLGLEQGTSAQVYEHDLQQVSNADAVIALIDEPSLGVGIELAHAVAHNKPLLALHHTEVSVTRMVRGAADLGLITLVSYKDEEDALRQGSRFLEHAL